MGLPAVDGGKGSPQHALRSFDSDSDGIAAHGESRAEVHASRLRQKLLGVRRECPRCVCVSNVYIDIDVCIYLLILI